ncbi:MAG: class II aldolase/adducin family protein [Novosphingobium sp.]|jgi:ribulose-5-phosphate 4-epimerase/fuculose-1-phosphate aldolase|nr:class II aldolase/adducin family protein [Novosphingobium sp.]
MTTAAKIEGSDEACVWQMRCELAAACRLVALFGWDDHIATHLSMRLPDGTFLLNPFGLMFDEITASSLMRLDMDGNLVEPCDFPLNPAGFNIHAGLLAARPDVNSVMHLHTRDGVAVSTLKEGLLPLSQNALNIWHDVAYHVFEGIATAGDERARLAADIGDRHLMILRNHGTLTAGRTIGAAFARLYMLEWACTAQVRTLSMGRELQLPAREVRDKQGAAMGTGWIDPFAGERFWPAMLRKAQRECPGFDL